MPGGAKLHRASLFWREENGRKWRAAPGYCGRCDISQGAKAVGVTQEPQHPMASRVGVRGLTPTVNPLRYEHGIDKPEVAGWICPF